MFRTRGADVPAERAFAEFLSSPEALRAGLAVEARHTEWGDYLRHGPLIKVAGQQCGGACVAGEHTATLLAELGCAGP